MYSVVLLMAITTGGESADFGHRKGGCGCVGYGGGGLFSCLHARRSVGCGCYVPVQPACPAPVYQQPVYQQPVYQQQTYAAAPAAAPSYNSAPVGGGYGAASYNAAPGFTNNRAAAAAPGFTNTTAPVAASAAPGFTNTTAPVAASAAPGFINTGTAAPGITNTPAVATGTPAPVNTSAGFVTPTNATVYPGVSQPVGVYTPTNTVLPSTPAISYGCLGVSNATYPGTVISGGSGCLGTVSPAPVIGGCLGTVTAPVISGGYTGYSGIIGGCLGTVSPAPITGGCGGVIYGGLTGYTGYTGYTGVIGGCTGYTGCAGIVGGYTGCSGVIYGGYTGCTGVIGGCTGWTGCSGVISGGCCGGIVTTPAKPEDKPKEDKPKEDKPKTDKPKTDDEVRSDAPARIVVKLPAEAKLTIDGAATKSTSEVRTFESPALESGKSYAYVLEAKYTKDGEEVVVSKKIQVEAGKTVNVDLNKTDAVASK